MKPRSDILRGTASTGRTPTSPRPTAEQSYTGTRADGANFFFRDDQNRILGGNRRNRERKSASQHRETRRQSVWVKRRWQIAPACFSDGPVCTSLSKRCRASGSLTSSSGRNFSAARRRAERPPRKSDIIQTGDTRQVLSGQGAARDRGTSSERAFW